MSSPLSASPLPLDASILALSTPELAFFAQTTGINDEQKLKAHIIRIQEKAYAVCPYPCIRNFQFTKLELANHPAYPDLLALGRSRPDPVLLDVGCGFGNDARKAVLDGWPVQGVVCSDLRAEAWELGHELFRDRDSFAVPFLAGDALDPAFLSPSPPSPPSPGEQNSTPTPLKEVRTLTHLHQRLSAIHASLFFHLFPLSAQQSLARSLLSLLSPQPGSIILGCQSGLAKPGPFVDSGGAYGHNVESWREMWSHVLGARRAEVRGQMRPWKAERGDRRGDREMLVWSVVLL